MQKPIAVVDTTKLEERQLPPAVGKLLEPDQSKAGIAVAKDGTRYRMKVQRSGGFETVQFVRESKVKGKAARKQERRARRLARGGA